MHTIDVNPSVATQKEYKIRIGNGLIEKISSIYDFDRHSKAFIITDETSHSLFLEKLTTSLPVKANHIILAPGEDQKNIRTIEKIWTAMHDAACDRKSVVINLGGGVVCDVGGFAASTYMRGLDFINVPTTLLSQVDSSVGGKTGFNYNGVKNLIGSFNQPNLVVIDPQLLASLPDREFLSGFAEIIKHGLIWDTAHLKQVTSKAPLDFTPAEMDNIITDSCGIKVAIIESDVNEEGMRKIVNFGHTVGHAIEVLSHDSDKPLTHGEAISVGMVAEADISHRLGFLSAADFEQIKQAFVIAGLPTQIGSLPLENVIKKMQTDKKNEAGVIKFTLLEKIGKAIYNQSAPENIVSDALQARMR